MAIGKCSSQLNHQVISLLLEFAFKMVEISFWFNLIKLKAINNIILTSYQVLWFCCSWFETIKSSDLVPDSPVNRSQSLNEITKINTKTITKDLTNLIAKNNH